MRNQTNCCGRENQSNRWLLKCKCIIHAKYVKGKPIAAGPTQCQKRHLNQENVIKEYFTYQIMTELNLQTCTLHVEMICEKAQNLRTQGHGAKPETDLKRSSPHRKGDEGWCHDDHNILIGATSPWHMRTGCLARKEPIHRGIFSLKINVDFLRASQVTLMVKKSPASVGDMKDGGWSMGQEDPLEEGMETNSTILAWRIPWAEEPAGLQSIGLQRVGHYGSNLALRFFEGNHTKEEFFKGNWGKYHQKKRSLYLLFFLPRVFLYLF